MDSTGPLSDADFYRLVACAAPPDEPCAKPLYRWDKTTITIGIVTRDPAFLGGKQKRAEAAVARAMQHLNAVGMSLTLATTQGDPDIAIHLLDIPRGGVIEMDTDNRLNGLTMANAIAALDVTGSIITGAEIAFSNTLPRRMYESVMLEEITQALGLITDIRSPYYRTRSILSQEGDNSLKTLGEQDTLALIRHYPPD